MTKHELLKWLDLLRPMVRAKLGRLTSERRAH
jgi:hypothetical protein